MRLSEIMQTENNQEGQRLSDVLNQEQVTAPKQTGFAAGMGGGFTSLKGLPTPEESKSLLKRLGKQVYNFFPELERGIYKTALRYDPDWYKRTEAARQKILTGELGEKEKQRLQENLKIAEKRGRAFQPFEIKPPETIGEYGVDISAGIGKFFGRLALLRKAMPKGTPEGLIWEMESQMSGEAPGKGTATYLAFSAPGKLIKGKTVAAATTRLLAESGIMAGTTAVEQYVNTGEIDPVEVAVSAGIPMAFRLPGFLKAGLRLGSKRTRNAIVLYKGPKEGVRVTPSEVGEVERIFKQKPETRASRLLEANSRVSRIPTNANIDGQNVSINTVSSDKIKFREQFNWEVKEGKPRFIESLDLPEVPDGYIRLYRGQNVDNPFVQRHPVNEQALKRVLGNQYKGQRIDTEAGGWWTPYKDYAGEFMQRQGKSGRLQYIDVPIDIANKYAVSPIQEGRAEEYFFPQLRSQVPLLKETKLLPAAKEQKRLPAQTQKALPMTAAEKQSRRYKLNQDRIDKRARELYDELLAKGEEGSKKSQKKISEFIQGQNLPTLESLYERVNAGDELAVQMIQEGLYSGSPESFIEGFRTQAAKELKIPYDVNKLKNRWTYVEGSFGPEAQAQKGELVPREYGQNQPVPERQMNVFRSPSGKILMDNEIGVRKSRKRSKKFPFGYETEFYDPKTGETLTPAPELMRSTLETEGQYKQRVYGIPEVPVVEGAVTREPRLQPGVTHERGTETLPPGARQLPGGETMVSAGEAVSPKRPEKPEVVYHGTPNIDIKKPKAFSFFTTDKSDADLYQAKNVSSPTDVTSKQMKGKTFKAEVNIKNPYKTTIFDANNIVSNPKEIKKLQDAGYDGIIAWLDKSYIGDKSQYLEYVPFNDSQIKVLEVTSGPTSKSFIPERPNVVEVQPVKFETAADTAEAKIREWVPKAKRLNRKERKIARKKFRAEQAAGGEAAEQEAMEKGKPASKILRAIKRGFRGRMPRPTIEPPNLNNKEWESLSAKIIKEYPKDVFARSTAQEALDTIRIRKEIPAPYDLGLLEPILGTETVVKLANEAYRAKIYNSADYLRLVRDGLKSTFGYDIQAARALRAIMFRHPIIYSQAVGINAKSYILELANAVSTKSNYLTFLSNNYSNRLSKEMKSRPSWEFGKEIGVNYLNETPWVGGKEGRLEQYGQFPEALDKLATSEIAKNNAPKLAKVVKGWSTWLKASEKGANLGIDFALQKLVEQAQKKGDMLVKRGLSPEKINKYYKNRAKVINEFTKRVTAKNPKWRQIQNAANWIFFSPSYTVSRPMGTFRSIANLFLNPHDRTYAMQLTLSNIASIAAIGSIFAAVGHKWKMQNPTEEPLIDGTNNPTDAMWGKGRVGNHVFDVTFGEASYYRLLARIGISAYYYATEKTGISDRRTSVMGRPLAPAGEEFMNYLNSRETVILGAAKTMLTGKDWLGRPIERKNELLQLIPFETVLSIIEAGQADGLWESMAEGDYSEASKDALAAAGIALAGFSSVGTASYPVPAAATRSSYQDIIAMEAHDRQWDELTPIEQKKLQLKHRKEFKNFESLIAKERVKNPINREKIIAEEKAAGDRIRSQLLPVVRAKLEEVPLNISRRPKDFYLNDERNNRYERLIVEYLNERLPKTRSENVNVLKSIVTSAKTKAWLQLKKEMSAEK